MNGATMQAVTVSVIIPNYNHGAFLEKRLASVLGQSFPDYEVIILDDCSRDDSRVIIEQYRNHPKVRHVVFNELNSGSAFQQWKKGFGYCAGAYVWIAESDDWCEPDFLQILVDGTRLSEECTLAFAQSRCVDETEKVRWETSYYQQPVLMNGQDFVRQHMLDRNSIVNASMALFRKDLLDVVPDDYTHFTYCGDWFFWIMIALRGSVYIYDKPLNYYRKHSADVTSGALATGLSISEEARLIGLLAHYSVVSTEEAQRLLNGCYSKFLNNRKRFSPKQVEIILGSFRSQFASPFSFMLFRSKARLLRYYHLIMKVVVNGRR